MASRAHFLLLFGALFGAGCGNEVDVATGGAGGAGSWGSTSAKGTTGSMTQASTGTGVVGPCPATAPDAGAKCDDPDRRCTYGDDPRPHCRVSATCTAGAWQIFLPKCPAPTSPAVCGAAPPLAGAACPMEGDYCVYADETICGCSGCFGGGPCMQNPVWQCTGAPAACPPPTPNAGTACAPEKLACTYGQPCGAGGVTMDCVGGSWVWQDTVCPL